MTPPRKDPKEIRAGVLARWMRLSRDLAVKIHCGGKGLAVGCPVCGKTFGKL